MNTQTNQTNPLKTQKNTLCLFVENKLGVIERVIGIFTLRGYKIENFICTQSKLTHLFNMKVCLNCTDKELEKLVKILHNQIHVLEIKLMMEDTPTNEFRVARAS